MDAPLASDRYGAGQDTDPIPPKEAYIRRDEAPMITVILFMLLGWFGCTLVMTVFASRATKPVA